VLPHLVRALRIFVNQVRQQSLGSPPILRLLHIGKDIFAFGLKDRLSVLIICSHHVADAVLWSIDHCTRGDKSVAGKFVFSGVQIAQLISPKDSKLLLAMATLLLAPPAERTLDENLASAAIS
jgi:hypothetical protein